MWHPLNPSAPPPSICCWNTEDHRGAGRRMCDDFTLSLPCLLLIVRASVFLSSERSRAKQLLLLKGWLWNRKYWFSFLEDAGCGDVTWMSHYISGSWGSGGRAGRPLIGRSVVWLPSSSGPRVDVSLNQILNPESLPMAVRHQCVNVCGCLASSDGWVGIVCGSPHHQGVSGWMWSVAWNTLSGQQTRKTLYKCSTFDINMSKCMVKTI